MCYLVTLLYIFGKLMDSDHDKKFLLQEIKDNHNKGAAALLSEINFHDKTFLGHENIMHNGAQRTIL